MKVKIKRVAATSGLVLTGLLLFGWASTRSIARDAVRQLSAEWERVEPPPNAPELYRTRVPGQGWLVGADEWDLEFIPDPEGRWLAEDDGSQR